MGFQCMPAGRAGVVAMPASMPCVADCLLPRLMTPGQARVSLGGRRRRDCLYGHSHAPEGREYADLAPTPPQAEYDDVKFFLAEDTGELKTVGHWRREGDSEQAPGLARVRHPIDGRLRADYWLEMAWLEEGKGYRHHVAYTPAGATEPLTTAAVDEHRWQRPVFCAHSQYGAQLRASGGFHQGGSRKNGRERVTGIVISVILVLLLVVALLHLRKRRARSQKEDATWDNDPGYSSLIGRETEGDESDFLASPGDSPNREGAGKRPFRPREYTKRSVERILGGMGKNTAGGTGGEGKYPRQSHNSWLDEEKEERQQEEHLDWQERVRS
ncbi:unnamed protein product [Chrysoparadoxa australica]